MSKSYVDPFDRANGALGSIPSGPAYEVLSGAFSISGNLAVSSTSPSSNPLAVVPIGKRSNGSCDMFAQVTPQHVYGNAAYVRVVDVNNWVRAVVRSYRTSYQYYNTEYYHPTYTTEYEYAYTEYYYAKYNTVTEYQYSYDVYSTWGSWNTYDTTFCRDTPPSTPSDTDTTQYRDVDLGTGGCTGGKRKYSRQSRTRTKNTYTCWSSTGPCFGGTANGNTRQGCSSAGYNIWYRAGQQQSCDITLNQTRTVYCWSSTGACNGGTATGNSRQIETGGYWDYSSTPAYTSTRQVGPYTGYNYYYGEVSLQKCVAGTITELDTYSPNSTSQVTLRLEAEGTALRVLRNGSLVCSAADAAHQTTGTKAGFGGGNSTWNPTNPSLNDFLVGGISSERIMVGGSLVTMNRKIMIGGVLVDFDTVVK